MRIQLDAVYQLFGITKWRSASTDIKVQSHVVSVRAMKFVRDFHHPTNQWILGVIISHLRNVIYSVRRANCMVK